MSRKRKREDVVVEDYGLMEHMWKRRRMEDQWDISVGLGNGTKMQSLKEPRSEGSAEKKRGPSRCILMHEMHLQKRRRMIKDPLPMYLDDYDVQKREYERKMEFWHNFSQRPVKETTNNLGNNLYQQENEFLKQCHIDRSQKMEDE